MHRFVVEDGLFEGAAVQLPEAEAQHALSVLRLKDGEAIQLSDGKGNLYAAVLQHCGERQATAQVKEQLPSNEPGISLTVYQGLPKGDKFDLIAQKLTELGASRIVPVRMRHCVVKLNEREGQKKVARWSRIVQEATKQCGRSRVPMVEVPVDWSRALEQLGRHDLVLLLWEQAQGKGIYNVFALQPNARDIAILIGPEGGISPSEVEDVEALGAHRITLGPRILRTETAAIAATAIAMYAWADLGGIR